MNVTNISFGYFYSPLLWILQHDVFYSSWLRHVIYRFSFVTGSYIIYVQMKPWRNNFTHFWVNDLILVLCFCLDFQEYFTVINKSESLYERGWNFVIGPITDEVFLRVFIHVIALLLLITKYLLYFHLLL